ncbi:MAG: NHL repeat-containing protein [Terriglobales bacterium]
MSDGANNRVLFYSFPLSTDQGANGVLGQGEFTTSGSALTAATFSEPVNTAEDNAGNLYVSDFNNSRVLQFKPPFSNGMSASLVIGQPDFLTGTSATTQNGLRAPAGSAFDYSGNLWVVDVGSNRILEYEPPFLTGMNASLVIGQANFTSGWITTTNAGLASPSLIVFDAKGNLWVTDSGNNRVLEFEPPFVSSMAATLVIGQVNFGASGAAATASGLSTPTGIAFDSAGNLWVGDSANSRVLQFKPTFATGMSASLVLGQANFTTFTSATTQSGLSVPVGIAFDSSGNLWVPDNGNNRTLVFGPPFSDDQNASLVLGQANFTTATATTTATGQSSPFAVTAAF